jgi:hexosaminidase
MNRSNYRPFILILSLFLILLTSASQTFAQLNQLLPTPQEITFSEKGSFTWSSDLRAQSKGKCEAETKLFNEWLSERTPIMVAPIHKTKGAKNKTGMFFECNPLLNYEEEEYDIEITNRSIVLKAKTATGISRGSQTLKQLLPSSFFNTEVAQFTSINAMHMHDKPAFEHRGLLLDCGRHFMDVATVKKYIDALAYYKLNVLHWHLTEDQGWRIEIKKYPELTRVGSYRLDAFGNHVSEGFYSQEEIKDIVAYAAARHVNIIPEIELPGHSVAAISAYPWLSCTGESIPVETEWGVFKDIYCAGNDSTIQFLKDVMDEVCALFPSPYIHIGGDEAPKFRWEHCPKCQNRMHDHGLKNEMELQTWLIEEMASYLHSKGKQIIGWDEILEGGIPADAWIQSWRGMEGGLAAAKAKHGVVMSPTSHCYIDYGLDNINLERVYSFNPIPPDCPKEAVPFIKGAECNMWTEHAPQEVLDSKVFPRLLALSEILWKADAKKDYDAFFNRVKLQYDALSRLNIKYGFADVPVSYRSKLLPNGLVEVSVVKASEDIVVRYKDETMLLENVAYTGPLVVSNETKAFYFEYFLKNSPNSFFETRRYTSNLATGKSISLSYTPSVYYPGGGESGLVDGRIGTANFRDGIWQAVQGKDLEAVIDLGHARKVKSVSTNWYHYANAWIFRPKAVEVYVSQDGQTWKLVVSQDASMDEDAGGEQVEEVILAFNEPTEVRYVKLIGKNNGPCPEWHDAVGEPSWLFCDEIIIN